MLSASRDWTRLPLGLVLLLGLGLRVAAVRFNAWPHGDVLLDAATVDSLVEHGRLLVPLVDVRYYPIERFGFGYPPDQHPPLWPLLGALLRPLWRDSYEALKLTSWAAGCLLVPAVYVCGRSLFGPGPGLLAAALCAVSWLLVDFSGNGSLWGLLALLYVLFVWRSACFPLTDYRNGVLLGVVMGAAYLTNYPAAVLPVSYLAIVFLRWREKEKERKREKVTERGNDVEVGRTALNLSVSPSLPLSLPSAAIPLAVAGLIALPWFLFNSVTFGNPIWSQPLERQLGGGDKQVEVVLRNGEAVKINLPAADPLVQRLRSTAADLYGNLGFLVRQSFVLGPFLTGFALAGLVTLSGACLRGGRQRAAPLLLLTLAHGALIVLWPTTKFRYLVPLFPLLALIGAGLLWRIQPSALRQLLVGLVLGLNCFTSAWTYSSIPSHTYYYDGGVVGDNFGGQGEIAYLEDLSRLERAAAAISSAGPGAVFGPHALYWLTYQPLVVNSPAFSREVAEHLVRHYGIRFVVTEPSRVGFYADLLPGQVLYQDDRYLVYEVAP